MILKNILLSLFLKIIAIVHSFNEFQSVFCADMSIFFTYKGLSTTAALQLIYCSKWSYEDKVVCADSLRWNVCGRS